MREVPFVLRCVNCGYEFVRDFELDSDISEVAMMGMTFAEHCPCCGDVDDFPIVSVADESVESD